MTDNIVSFLEVLPAKDLHPGVLEALEREAAKTGRWCVGLSGGSDSVAALLLAVSMRPGGVVALHFNHGLRGGESDADEVFCRELCRDLKVGFRCGCWVDRPAKPGEAEAREARHRFYRESLAEVGARVLWTGHHLDDVAETLLMRVGRGSSVAGLAAPRPVQEMRDGHCIVRPLLAVRKRRILDALRAGGFAWREDGSNASNAYLRNRIRQTVTPVWVAAFENDAVAGAALTRELIAEDDAALEAWLDELLPPSCLAPGRADLAGVAGKPRALLRRALRRWGGTAGLSGAHLDRLVALAGQDSTLPVDGGHIRVRGWVFEFEPVASVVPGPWEAGILRPGVSVHLPDGGELAAASVEYSDELRQQVLTGRVDAGRQAYLGHFYGSFTVRPWTPGDRFRPLGFPGSAKVQDIFVNRKVPGFLRQSLPVVCGPDGSIVWIPGLPPAENSKVGPDSVMGVQLTYLPGTSTVAS